MRKFIILFVLLSTVLVLGTFVAAEDDNPTSVITVKANQKDSGVVTLLITKQSKSFLLTCNEGMPSCAALSKGDYKMVELPKNHGIYDCQNVRVYAASAEGTEEDKELGQYCIVEK